MEILNKINELKKNLKAKIDETRMECAMKRSDAGVTNFSKADEKEMMRLIDAYISGKMKPEEMLIFINLTKRYFYSVKNLDAGIGLPKTSIEIVTKKDPETGLSQIDEGVVAAYNHARNIFIVNESTFKKCVASISGTDKSVLMDVVNFTGHELTHFDQHLTNTVFEGLSPAEQKKFDKKTYEVIKDIEDGSDVQLDVRDLMQMDSFMGKYTKSMQDFGLSVEHFQVFQKVRYAKYTYERDARSGAIDFAREFVKLIKNSEYASPSVKAWASQSERDIERFEQKEIMIENEIINQESGKMLEKYYQTVGRQVLSALVKDNEHKEFNLTQSIVYKRCLAEIIEHCTYEEKEAYLKVAIANNLPQFANVVIKSIKRDPEYLEHNEELKNMLTDALAKGEFDMGEEKPPKKIVFGNVHGENIELSRLLSEDRLGYCVMESLSRDDYAGAFKMASLIKTNYFSKQHILEQAERIEKGNLRGKEYAMKALIVNLSFEDIVSLMETSAKNNLPTLKKEILEQLNKMPEFHLNRKDVLKRLSRASGEQQFVTDEEMIIKGCAQFSNNFYFESMFTFMNNQKPEDFQAMQSINNLYKTIYKQECKKGGKQLESQLLADTTIKEFLQGSEFEFEVAERVAENKATYLNLLKTLTEESIVIDGQKFVLDADTKMKLTSLLVAIINQKELNRQLAELEKQQGKINV